MTQKNKTHDCWTQVHAPHPFSPEPVRKVVFSLSSKLSFLYLLFIVLTVKSKLLGASWRTAYD